MRNQRMVNARSCPAVIPQQKHHSPKKSEKNERHQGLPRHQRAQIPVPLNRRLGYSSALKFNWIGVALVAWGIGAENT